MMRIEEGDEIAGMWVSPEIPGVGLYKILAKRTANGLYDWIQFLQKPDGFKKTLFSEMVSSKEELQAVVGAAKRDARRVFGDKIQLQVGIRLFIRWTGRDIATQSIE